ncbi:MAG: PTS lactose/cellobiose transporter subunit IIA [Firmicutes bacterium]|nr:PTS lactose/cellobiose transporter subunit IIA [Bacillota bacterium]MCL1953118.1 PTS lactose/cellobiose transporter subunit IIA [Bacillota bacterium]
MSDQSKKDVDIMTVMNLIVDAGNGKSLAMEAIYHAKDGDFEAAHKALKESNEAISGIHNSQTELIQSAARGENIDVSLFMVHAQDHVMTAILAKDLATEIVELHERLAKNQLI